MLGLNIRKFHLRLVWMEFEIRQAGPVIEVYGMREVLRIVRFKVGDHWDTERTRQQLNNEISSTIVQQNLTSAVQQ